MVTNKNKQLKNPPISESRIGLFAENIFKLIPDISLIKDILTDRYEYEKIEEKGPLVDMTEGVNVEHVFNNKDKPVILVIEKSRILFINQEKYTEFGNVYGYVEDLLKIFKKNKIDFKLNAVALTTQNKFSTKLSNTAISALFPAVTLGDPKSPFAYIHRSDTSVGIFKKVNDKNKITDGVLKYSLNLEDNMQVSFETEVRSRYKEGLGLEALFNELLFLKDFRNDIFYENVETDKIEAFNE
ncbi:TIGR04255 family protein [Parelusimicrobium proximum]|uniref:hypothetical protein n=1 Tax=Parelusimicrobium proximum TaxID=3228953 RepID=UPI003D170FC8